MLQQTLDFTAYKAFVPRFTLRGYQQQCSNEIVERVRPGARICLVAGTGSGKTCIAADVMRRLALQGHRMIFCVDSNELVTQTHDKLIGVGLSCGFIKAGYRENRSSPIQLASIQTMRSRSWWEEYHFDVVLTDECLTGDSLVMTDQGPWPIGDPGIVGKSAWSFNEDASEWEWRKITRHFVQGVKQTVTVVADGREIRCTPNHLLRTTEGWKKAEDLLPGDRILTSDESGFSLERNHLCVSAAAPKDSAFPTSCLEPGNTIHPISEITGRAAPISTGIGLTMATLGGAKGRAGTKNLNCPRVAVAVESLDDCLRQSKISLAGELLRPLKSSHISRLILLYMATEKKSLRSKGLRLSSALFALAAVAKDLPFLLAFLGSQSKARFGQRLCQKTGCERRLSGGTSPSLHLGPCLKRKDLAQYTVSSLHCANADAARDCQSLLLRFPQEGITLPTESWPIGGTIHELRGTRQSALWLPKGRRQGENTSPRILGRYRMKSLAESTEPSWATLPYPSHTLQAVRALLGRMGCFSRAGQITRLLASQASRFERALFRMLATARPLLGDAAGRTQDLRMSTALSGPVVGQKSSLETGLTGSPLKAGLGGTWMTAQSGLMAGGFSFTLKAILAPRWTCWLNTLQSQAISRREGIHSEGRGEPGITRSSLLTLTTQSSGSTGSVSTPRLACSTSFLTVKAVRRGAEEPVFDIEVEGNHNFLANCMLVHNCHITSFSAVARKMMLETHPEACYVGLTATPWRTNPREGFTEVFNEMVSAPLPYQLMEMGHLSPSKAYYGLPEPDLKDVHKRGGDYKEEELANACDRPELIQRLVQEYLRLTPGRRAIAFAVNINHSKNIAEAFRMAGVRAAHIDGTMDNERECKPIYAAIASGEIEVLSSVCKLVKGFDCPPIEVGICARPTESRSLHFQMLGRVMRLSPETGKTGWTWLDQSGNILKFGMVEDLKEIEFDEPNQADKREPLTKQCQNCMALNHISARLCKQCGHPFPEPEGGEQGSNRRVYDGNLILLERRATLDAQKDGLTTQQKMNRNGLRATIKACYRKQWSPSKAFYDFKSRHGVEPKEEWFLHAIFDTEFTAQDVADYWNFLCGKAQAIGKELGWVRWLMGLEFGKGWKSYIELEE